MSAQPRDHGQHTDGTTTNAGLKTTEDHDMRAKSTIDESKPSSQSDMNLGYAVQTSAHQTRMNIGHSWLSSTVTARAVEGSSSPVCEDKMETAPKSDLAVLKVAKPRPIPGPKPGVKATAKLSSPSRSPELDMLAKENNILKQKMEQYEAEEEDRLNCMDDLVADLLSAREELAEAKGIIAGYEGQDRAGDGEKPKDLEQKLLLAEREFAELDRAYKEQKAKDEGSMTDLKTQMEELQHTAQTKDESSVILFDTQIAELQTKVQQAELALGMETERFRDNEKSMEKRHEEQIIEMESKIMVAKRDLKEKEDIFRAKEVNSWEKSTLAVKKVEAERDGLKVQLEELHKNAQDARSILDQERKRLQEAEQARQTWANDLHKGSVSAIDKARGDRNRLQLQLEELHKAHELAIEQRDKAIQAHAVIWQQLEESREAHSSVTEQCDKSTQARTILSQQLKQLQSEHKLCLQAQEQQATADAIIASHADEMQRLQSEVKFFKKNSEDRSRQVKTTQAQKRNLESELQSRNELIKEQEGVIAELTQ